MVVAVLAFSLQLDPSRRPSLTFYGFLRLLVATLLASPSEITLKALFSRRLYDQSTRDERRGFLWSTSAGGRENTEKAKQVDGPRASVIFLG